MDNVSAHVNAEVSADGAGRRVERLGGSEHLAAGKNGVVTFPDHSADGAGDSVLDETSEEAFGGEVSVVLFELLFAGGAKFHANKLESLGLEAADNLANESSLDTIGLDHDEGSFSLRVNHLV